MVSGPNPVQQWVQDALLLQSQAAQHARPLRVGEELVSAAGGALLCPRPSPSPEP